VIAAWLEKYRHTERPHSALGYLTPREFAEQLAAWAVRRRGGRYTLALSIHVSSRASSRRLRLRGICRPSSRRPREGASRAPPSSILGVLHEVQSCVDDGLNRLV